VNERGSGPLRIGDITGEVGKLAGRSMFTGIGNISEATTFERKSKMFKNIPKIFKNKTKQQYSKKM
jgi:hypothetical protein